MSFHVWVGCLACYNDGILRGQWVDALDAAEYVPCQNPTHEEYWVMDNESGGWIDGECSPAEATRIAELVEDIPEDERDAARAWLDDTGESEWDAVRFQDSYCGEWGSFREYADNLVEDLGLLAGVDECVRMYFDFEAYARDLEYEYTVSDAPGGRVYVFQAL